VLILVVAGCSDDQKGPGKPGAKRADTSAKTTSSQHGGAADSAAGLPAVATDFAAASPIVDTSVSFRFQLTPRVGDVYHYRITQRTDTQVDSLKGTEQTIFNFHTRVNGLNDDGSIAVEMVYDSVRYNLNVPASPLNPKAESFSYSTRQKPDEKKPATVQAYALVGRKVNLTISAKGEVTEVSNVEPIVSAMLGKYRDSLSAAAIEQVRGGIKASAFQAMVSQLFLRSRPDGDVRIGRTWNRKDTVPVGGIPMAISAIYRLAEVRTVEELPVGRIVTDLTFSFPRKKFDLPGGSIVLDQAAASGRGEVIQNLQTGFPTRKTNRIEVRLKMTARSKEKDPATGLQSKTVSQRMIQTLAIEMVEISRGE